MELKVHDDWWWWSGYPLKRSSWQTRLAETDGPRFYDKAAFPSLKPDIDIFGVPQRSRKQRGWYQITPPLQPSPPAETHRALATPSNMPVELFKDILRYLSMERPTLARCGQVCRYWARECRRELFDTVKLQGHEDVLYLLDLMKSPAGDVSRFLRHVETSSIQNVRRTPWMHILPLIGDCSMQPSHKIDFHVRLEGPLAPGQRSLRSIHYALPRVLPRFSRHIEWLDLKDLHFAKLSDLMHLLWEMPQVAFCRCTNVTWGSFPMMPFRRKPRCLDPAFAQTTLTLDKRCGPSSVEAAVWLSTSLSVHKSDLVLSFDDITRMLTIARTIDKTTSGKLALKVTYHPFRE